jgi:superfamily II DNA helicase RecQ
MHIDWLQTILDYTQESGRAGRDGLPSKAIIIAREGDQLTDIDKEVQAEQQLVALYTEEGNRAAECRQ